MYVNQIMIRQRDVNMYNNYSSRTQLFLKINKIEIEKKIERQLIIKHKPVYRH